MKTKALSEFPIKHKQGESKSIPITVTDSRYAKR